MRSEATGADKDPVNSNQEMAAVQSALLLNLHLQYLACFLRKIKRASVDETHLIANYSPPPLLPPTGNMVFKDMVFFVLIPENSTVQAKYLVTTTVAVPVLQLYEKP